MSGFVKEKHLGLLVLGVVIILLLIIYLLYGKHQETLQKLDRNVINTEQELEQMQERLQQYRLIEGKLQLSGQGATNAENSNLISAVENATQQIGARDLLLYVRPQPDKVRDDLVEEGVEIRLERLQLNQLVDLLLQLESIQRRLRVNQLTIRTRFDNQGQLDVVMVVSRFREKV